MDFIWEWIFVLYGSNGETYSSLEDGFNINKKRNEENTKIKEYNCFGYAFETYNWGYPIQTWEFIDTLYYMVDNYYDSVDCEEEQKTEDEFIRDTLNHFSSNFNTDSIEELEDFLRNDCNDIFIEIDNLRYNKKLRKEKDSIKLYNISKDIYSFSGKYHPFTAKIAIDHILKNFKDVRRIKNFNELETDEYGIVMGFSGNDFHFVKYQDGIISHKLGGNEIEMTTSIEEALGKYNKNKPVYFAKKKGSNYEYCSYSSFDNSLYIIS